MTAMRSLPLSSVAKIDRVSLAPEKIQSGTAYLGLEHIESGGKILGAQSVDSGELKSSKFRFTSQHILYGKLRPYLAKIALPDFDGICSTDIIPILPGPDIERKYLLYFLRQGSMVDYANSRSSGANLPRLSPKELANFQVPLPPLEEQKRIAKILDVTDLLRAKRRESLTQLDALLQSTFLDLFGDPAVNDRGWNVARLGDLLDSIDGGWSPKCLDRRADPEEWGVLKLGSVTKCFYDEAEQKALPKDAEPRPAIEVREGDLLFSRKNTKDLVCAAAYVSATRRKLLIPDLIFRFRPKDYLNSCVPFLWQLLVNPRQRRIIQSLAGGAAGSMPNISKAKLREVLLIQPPVELQIKYSRIVNGIEAEKNKLQAHLEEFDSLGASLQQRAFSGEF